MFSPPPAASSPRTPGPEAAVGPFLSCLSRHTVPPPPTAGVLLVWSILFPLGLVHGHKAVSPGPWGGKESGEGLLTPHSPPMAGGPLFSQPHENQRLSPAAPGPSGAPRSRGVAGRRRLAAVPGEVGESRSVGRGGESLGLPHPESPDLLAPGQKSQRAAWVGAGVRAGRRRSPPSGVLSPSFSLLGLTLLLSA